MLKNVTDLKKSFEGPMSEAEIDFLGDLKGFVDYAIRNGLSFPLVMNVLAHDLGGIRGHGDDVKAALADHFNPKVSGYAQVSEESVGSVDQQ